MLLHAVTFRWTTTATPSSFYLAPGEQKTIKLNIVVGERGLIAGKIRFKSGADIVAESTTLVNIMSENFLFDSSISLAKKQRTILSGETLAAQIDIEQVGPQEKIDVVANYIIKDFAGNSYLEDSETFYVLGSKTFSKEFHTEALPPGKYVLGLEIVYPGAFATSSVQFEVLEKSPASQNLSASNLPTSASQSKTGKPFFCKYSIAVDLPDAILPVIPKVFTMNYLSLLQSTPLNSS